MVAKSTLQTILSIPLWLNELERDTLGDMIVIEIRDRTRRGKDVDDNNFKRYSKLYINSLDFKNANKKASKVNLTATGDTLAELDVISHKTGSITIGYPTDYYEAEKIEGLVLGASGKAGMIGNAKSARPFIGLPSDELDKLILKVGNGRDSGNLDFEFDEVDDEFDEFKEFDNKNTEVIKKSFGQSIVDSIFKKLGF